MAAAIRRLMSKDNNNFNQEIKINDHKSESSEDDD